jgi:hypothetical protein
MENKIHPLVPYCTHVLAQFHCCSTSSLDVVLRTIAKSVPTSTGEPLFISANNMSVNDNEFVGEESVAAAAAAAAASSPPTDDKDDGSRIAQTPTSISLGKVAEEKVAEEKQQGDDNSDDLTPSRSRRFMQCLWNFYRLLDFNCYRHLTGQSLSSFGGRIFGTPNNSLVDCRHFNFL